MKLDIGSGRAHFEDYITIDKDPRVGADICADIELGLTDELREKILPIYEIRAHHILEHIKPENKVKVMRLFYDLLDVGGVLDIEVPLFPHPASVQDPTHLSFWCKESFKYFIKDDPFGEAFAKRYSECEVPLFGFMSEWWRGDEAPFWAYGIKLIKL